MVGSNRRWSAPWLAVSFVVVVGCATIPVGCGGGSPIGPPPATGFAAIVVTPAGTSLQPGADQGFVASCRSDQGGTIACPTMSWQAPGGTWTTTSSTNDTAGTFTAGSTAGSYQLAAAAGGVTQTAAVTIVPPNPNANVIVNAGQTYQTIVGWEATLSDGWGFSAAGYAALATLTAEIGINRIRLQATGNIIESVSPAQTGNCAGASSQWIGQNDNSDPNSVNQSGFRWYCFDRLVQHYVLPVKAAVEARGEPFVLNTCYVGFNATAGFQQSSPAEYAEFVVTVLKHLKQTFNLEPDIWEARLEPDNGSTAISGAQLGAMIAAAAPAVRAAGFQKVKFAAPSTLDSKKAVPYFDAIRNTAGVAPYLAELSYHLYGSPGSTTLNDIKTTAAAAGVQTAMLEYTTATASTLLADLTKAGVSSWQQYGLAGPYPNAPSLIKVDTLTESMEIRPAAYPLIQFFRYVRPGAVRIGVTSKTGTIAPVAFRNANGKFVVVANTTAGATLNVSGVPAGTYDVSFSTSAAPGAVGAPVVVAAGGVLTASIPAAGTITLSQQ